MLLHHAKQLLRQRKTEIEHHRRSRWTLATAAPRGCLYEFTCIACSWTYMLIRPTLRPAATHMYRFGAMPGRCCFPRVTHMYRCQAGWLHMHGVVTNLRDFLKGWLAPWAGCAFIKQCLSVFSRCGFTLSLFGRHLQGCPGVMLAYVLHGESDRVQESPRTTMTMAQTKRWGGWCLCCSAGRPACATHRAALAERTLAMTLMGVRDIRYRL